MIQNSSDKLENMNIPTKQEGKENTSRLWSSTLRNPRIVRVSRTFGGKDRHSKVTTIRGLRDRRVRLSVPTAIQLYDLQDRLGVNQPSKVVDWLLNAAHQEIDKLPPLPLPPGGSFAQDHQDLNSSSQVVAAENSVASEGMMSMYTQATEEVVPPYYHWDATNAYLSQFGIRPLQAEAPPHDSMPMFPSYFSASAEFDTKSFVAKDSSSLHLGGPSRRPFQ